MSGHSKWANIKRKKGINDVKKSQTFSKLSKLITVAAAKGGPDPDSNPTLRLAIEKAKYGKMPKENIDRAIQKGSGDNSSDRYEEVTYEGYGPTGVAFLVKALTDNKNRTVAEIKTVFNRAGGSLGAPGSTAYIFSGEESAPIFTVKLEDAELIEKIEKLEETLEDHDDVQEVYSNYEL